MKSKYLKSFIQFFSANFIARAISLVREVILASILGPSKILDIFFFIIAIPEFINQIWTRPLETIILKEYVIDKNDNSLKTAKSNLSGHIVNFIFISFLLYIIVSVFFPIIIYYFYNSYYSEYIIPAVFFVNTIFLFETYLILIRVVRYSENNFFLPTVIPIIQSITMIFGILYFNQKLTLVILAIFYAIGGFLQLTLFFKKEFFVLCKFFTSRILLLQESKILQDTLRISMASGLSSMNIIIDQIFALNHGEASNSYIHYGYFFLTVYSFLIVKNINTVLYPQFQKYYVENKVQELLSDIQKMTKIIFLITTVSITLLLTNGLFIIEKLIGHGKVSTSDLQIIYYCTLGYAGAFWGTAMNSMLVRIVQIYSEYRILIIVAIVNFISNIIFNFVLLKMFGIWGIAISTSFSFTLIVIIYLVYLRGKRKIVFFKDFNWYLKFSLWVVLTAIFVYIMVFKMNLYSNNQIIHNLLTFTFTVLFIIAGLFSLGIVKIKNSIITI